MVQLVDNIRTVFRATVHGFRSGLKQVRTKNTLSDCDFEEAAKILSDNGDFMYDRGTSVCVDEDIVVSLEELCRRAKDANHEYKTIGDLIEFWESEIEDGH